MDLPIIVGIFIIIFLMWVYDLSRDRDIKKMNKLMMEIMDILKKIEGGKP